MLGNEAGKDSRGGENGVRLGRCREVPHSRGRCAGAAGVALRAVVTGEAAAGFSLTPLRGGVVLPGRAREIRAGLGAASAVVMVRGVCGRYLVRAQAHPNGRDALHRQGEQKQCSHEGGKSSSHDPDCTPANDSREC